MEETLWYGARTIYEFVDKAGPDSHIYEERVTLIKAISFEEAIEKAELEASEYASEESGTKYLGFVSLFKISDEKVTENTEVFSLLRKSELNPKEYIDRFFDTGHEFVEKH